MDDRQVSRGMLLGIEQSITCLFPFDLCAYVKMCHTAFVPQHTGHGPSFTGPKSTLVSCNLKTRVCD